MGRAALLLALLVLPLGSAGCSSTDLGSVDLVGRWDGVGALEASDDADGITVYIESHTGQTITGRWTRNATYSDDGTIADGAVQEDGEITFTLAGFFGLDPDPTFTGRLTDQHRMLGDLEPVSLSGSAVFRRGSVNP